MLISVAVGAAIGTSMGGGHRAAVHSHIPVPGGAHPAVAPIAVIPLLPDLIRRYDDDRLVFVVGILLQQVQQFRLGSGVEPVVAVGTEEPVLVLDIHVIVEGDAVIRLIDGVIAAEDDIGGCA